MNTPDYEALMARMQATQEGQAQCLARLDATRARLDATLSRLQTTGAHIEAVCQEILARLRRRWGQAGEESA